MCQPQFVRCMEACLDCAIVCQECARHFHDVPEKAEFVQFCQDCADVCLICCSDLRENSQLVGPSVRACRLACEALALDCENHPALNLAMCHAACRRCAAECREVGQRIEESETPWV
jgi:hypothetical protein